MIIRYAFGAVAFLVFYPLSFGGAQALPPDWDCAQTYRTFPRIVPAGEVSVLANVPPKTVAETPEQSTYKLNMVRIAPGEFMMGSPPFEEKREGSEGPQVKVKIDYAFEIGKFEVTFDDWNTCLTGGGCRGHHPKDAGWGQGSRPVINVSWQDTQSYIRWLNSVTGLNYRLPSEAEWEYVARAGTTTPFYTGETISAKQANFNGQDPYLDEPKSEYRRKTLPVGSFEANPFGVHDMLGNAFEWVQDCWNDSHLGAPKDGEARLEGACKFRVMKGGSWVTYSEQVRAAKRTQYTTDYRYDDYGFRIARTLPE